MKKLVPHNSAPRPELCSGTLTNPAEVGRNLNHGRLSRFGRIKSVTLAWLVVISILILFFEPGCRRSPRNSPEKYESEIATKVPHETAPTWLPDNAPWEGKNSEIKNLPERIQNKQIALENEMKSFDKVFKSHALGTQ